MTLNWNTTGDVEWRMRVDAPDTVEYLPREPSPVRVAGGRPAILFLHGGGGYHLQLQAQWDPPADALEGLRGARERALGRGVLLAPPAALEVLDATLELGAGRTGRRQLQRVTTSGYPPYSALFAVGLEEEEGAAVAGALRGEHDRLAVRFRARNAGLVLDRRTDVAGWVGPGDEIAAQVVAADVRALTRSRSNS